MKNTPGKITIEAPDVEIFIRLGEKTLYRRIKAYRISSTIMPEENAFLRPQWLFEIQGVILEQRDG